MKLLLDMYRSAPKEQRDKVQLMAAEKKTKAEVNLSFTHIHIQINLCLHETGTFHFILRVYVCQAEELRQRLRDLEERERREGKKMADEEALRKIRLVEDQIDILNKKLSLAKQVCVSELWVCVCECVWLVMFQCSFYVCVQKQHIVTNIWIKTVFFFLEDAKL